MADDDDLDFSVESLKNAGFHGFITFAALLDDQLESVPCQAGAYIVIRASRGSPTFLDTSSGGYFKRRNPVVSRETLTRKWIDDCGVLYIGKADRSSPRRSLRRRLDEYARFGRGDPIGHWGGRFIWQLADADDLLVAWRAARPGQTGTEAEAELVEMFKRRFGRLPFANIADPTRRKRRADSPANAPVSETREGGNPQTSKRNYLLNTDGSGTGTVDNPAQGAIGVVLRDPDGRPIREISERIGPAINTVAEYRALIEGLRLARSCGIQRIRVFLDSELVVDQVSGRAKVGKEHIKPLHAEACSLLREFANHRISWVPRKWNAEADALATNALLDR